MPGGRPTDYRPEYCEMLIAHMRQGYSIEAFAGVIGVCKATLYNWLESHPEFLDAKRVGEDASRLFWERIGIHAAIGKPIEDKDGRLLSLKNFSAPVWIFNMKNRFNWRDRQEIEHSTPPGEPLDVRISRQTDEALIETVRILSQKLLCSATKKD